MECVGDFWMCLRGLFLSNMLNSKKVQFSFKLFVQALQGYYSHSIVPFFTSCRTKRHWHHLCDVIASILRFICLLLIWFQTFHWKHRNLMQSIGITHVLNFNWKLCPVFHLLIVIVLLCTSVSPMLNHLSLIILITVNNSDIDSFQIKLNNWILMLMFIS